MACLQHEVEKKQGTSSSSSELLAIPEIEWLGDESIAISLEDGTGCQATIQCSRDVLIMSSEYFAVLFQEYNDQSVPLQPVLNCSVECATQVLRYLHRSLACDDISPGWHLEWAELSAQWQIRKLCRYFRMQILSAVTCAAATRRELHIILTSKSYRGVEIINKRISELPAAGREMVKRNCPPSKVEWWQKVMLSVRHSEYRTVMTAEECEDGILECLTLWRSDLWDVEYALRFSPDWMVKFACALAQDPQA